MRFNRAILSRTYGTLRALRIDYRGVASVEVGLVSSVLGLLMLGVIDFGQAYVQQMELRNAVRAGTQFALVRHPSLGPGADEQQALTSLQTVRDSVVASAHFLESDPGTDELQVCVFYVCPGDPPSVCTTTTGTTPTCSTWQTFLRVDLSFPYSLILPYPGLDDNLTLRASSVVRMN